MKKFNILLILAIGFVSNIFCGQQGQMPKKLKDALVAGNLKRVKSLDMHIRKRTQNGRTALHWAVIGTASLSLIRYLIEDKGFDINAKDNNGNTPLSTFEALGDSLNPKKALKVFKYFAQKGASLEEEAYDYGPLDGPIGISGLYLCW